VMDHEIGQQDESAVRPIRQRSGVLQEVRSQLRETRVVKLEPSLRPHGMRAPAPKDQPLERSARKHKMQLVHESGTVVWIGISREKLLHRDCKLEMLFWAVMTGQHTDQRLLCGHTLSLRLPILSSDICGGLIVDFLLPIP